MRASTPPCQERTMRKNKPVKVTVTVNVALCLLAIAVILETILK